jgi:hypothetical protein
MKNEDVRFLSALVGEPMAKDRHEDNRCRNVMHMQVTSRLARHCHYW